MCVCLYCVMSELGESVDRCLSICNLIAVAGTAATFALHADYRWLGIESGILSFIFLNTMTFSL